MTTSLTVVVPPPPQLPPEYMQRIHTKTLSDQEKKPTIKELPRYKLFRIKKFRLRQLNNKSKR